MGMDETKAGVRHAVSATAHGAGAGVARATRAAEHAAAPALAALTSGVEHTRTAGRQAAHAVSGVAERSSDAVGEAARRGGRLARRRLHPTPPASRRRGGRAGAAVGLLVAVGAVVGLGRWAVRRRHDDLPPWLRAESPTVTETEEQPGERVRP
ncbi:hypothetical protein SAMN05216371_8045 [Streptomyces sp. TLI_053]|uniref:hypothetical protein n=1 Tax=Streptomyces sp. TLI_053 TaxID=1855352 RepID=UPI0008792A35|nr:hypothetical protein [Streptomyces sp. TLI_053]SDT83230.1 hypothetical protein SAMN05216371_8045 [Streptomyces sp. TLI_053]